MPRHELPPGTREFFARLSSLFALNPFSTERNALLNQLIPGHAEGAMSLDPKDYALTAEVDRHLQDLDHSGATRQQQFSGQDRELVAGAYLYQIYQRLVPDLDTLIRTHEKRSSPTEVQFASDALAALKQRGFSERQALFNFAFAFQLRRAFYFIVDAIGGNSACMHRLRLQLWNNVFTHDLGNYQQVLVNRLEDFSTLLLGETGVGKGQAAIAIGRSGFIPFDLAGNRFAANYNDVFIATNLSQYPEPLIESELFGHRKGAFTGAISDHNGLLERCSAHGALFLDEIGEVSLAVQIKLLDVLQSRTFMRVGGHRARRFSGRVIAATNQSLDQLRSQGRFREDFFYRLCSDVIRVPSLRQRIAESGDELPLLVTRLLKRITGGDHPNLVDLVLERLADKLPEDHPWPGNVRELEQVVRAILLTGDYQGNPISSGSGDPSRELARELQRGELNAQDLLGRYSSLLYQRLGTYEAVARRLQLDRRTARKYIEHGNPKS